MKRDRKQDLNVIYHGCVFQADRKSKMTVLASDWLRPFRLLLWNCLTDFNEAWQEARSQRPLPSLCFSRRSKIQDGRPGLWLFETFSTSSLKPLNGLCFSGRSEIQDDRPALWLTETFSTCLKPPNGIKWNLTGSKISTSSYQVCVIFFGPIGKSRWSPCPLIGWDIFDFFSETAERNTTKLDRKQDLNVLCQACVFRADRKSKIAALASDWLRHFRLLLCNCSMEFDETW